jgi:hypothetical protein
MVAAGTDVLPTSLHKADQIAQRIVVGERG